MRIFIIILLINIIFNSAKAQTLTSEAKPKSSNEKESTEPTFKNQGEQEDYWGEQLFKTQYKRQEFLRFKGQITPSKDAYNYDGAVLNLSYIEPELKIIFEKGIFYPQLLVEKTFNESEPKIKIRIIKSEPRIEPQSDSVKSSQIAPLYNLTRIDSLTISNFEELKFLSQSPRQKRFRFRLWRKGLPFETVYFIELTNESATSQTDITTFIKDSSLTFLKEGWVIL
ncbi:MAG TPA: hypothetical protein VGI43_18720 [Mucilaginibacter sp.]|jgi:hypothetical protein